MKIRNLSAILLLCTFIGCNAPKDRDSIRLNQVGYYPCQEKIAVFDDGRIEQFTIENAATGVEVYVGKPSYVASTPWSDKRRSILDFTILDTPGKYILRVGDFHAAFEIKEEALSSLARAALKSFFYQRTGMNIETVNAGKWSRAAGHPDTCVVIHPSAVGPTRKAGDIISSSKGWYDAGDYNKYIVNSAYAIGLMQTAYGLFPDYFARQNVNIPESQNQTPDLLDEVYYNLSWMLTMQDPADGGVYHKLTTALFEPFIQPSNCSDTRYVVQKSVTAALDFAAVFAQASRQFALFEQDYPGFSVRAIDAAQRAYDWAIAHPEAYYIQEELNRQYEPDILTGAYGDTKATDELFWAASELYFATGDEVYRDKAVEYAPTEYDTSSWDETAALGYYVWLLPNRELNQADQPFANRLKEQFMSYAAKAIENVDKTAFHTPFGNKEKDFFWGCLGEKCANQAFTLIYAYLLSNQKEYLSNACRNMDYILGRNATGYCYVTGFGTKSPMNPHHGLSITDDVLEPIPGFLVGGPNPNQEDGVDYPSSLPDESYLDKKGVASYSSNEVAINWSAELVILSSAIDALSDNL